MNKLFRSLLLLSFILLLTACPKQKASASETKDLHQQMMDMISNKQCQKDYHCTIIGVGEKPCGGPDTYEVYSKLHTDSLTLKSIAKKYHKQRKEYNTNNQLMGICMVEQKPKAKCIKSICKAVLDNSLE